MTTIWAIARQMISEGIRMKLALVFLIVIGLLVFVLPFGIRGDSSLTGAVQSYMSYALSASGVLLGMLTIFMSRSFSQELVFRQIFLVMTKPVPRWKYIVGKWMGISMINTAFLVFAGMCVFGMVQYLRVSHPPADEEFDRAELENQILVARHGRSPILPDFKAPAEREYQRNLEEGLYDGPSLKPDQERRNLMKKYEAAWRVVEPLGVRTFEYDNVLCERTAENLIQLRYRTNVSYYPSDEVFRAWWAFGDEMKGTPVYERPVRHIVDRMHTVTFPADAVASDGTLRVRFYNQNPFYPSEPHYRMVIEFRSGDEPEILFVVGSFAGNLLRLILLMACKLLFLAAVSVLAAAGLSYPVACMVSFTVYLLAGARGFISEALESAEGIDAGIFDSIWGFFVSVFSIVMEGLKWVIPDFSYYNGLESLISGRNVSLVWVLQGLGDLALVKTVIVLGLAMLLFQRRELAEVSL